MTAAHAAKAINRAERIESNGSDRMVGGASTRNIVEAELWLRSDKSRMIS
jgi:hypothetical protein